MIHFCTPHLDKVPVARSSTFPIAEILTQVQTLLKPYRHIIWKEEKPSDLRQHIGKLVKSGQALWYHKKRVATWKGLYQ